MRKLMWFTIGFAAACAFCAYLYVRWLWIVGVMCGFTAVLLLFAMRWYRPIRIVAVIVLGIAVGIGWFLGYDGVYLNGARNADGKTLHAMITLTDYSYQTNYGSAFDGTVSLSGRLYRVRGYLDTKHQLAPGDAVEGEFEFRLTTNGALEEPTYHQGKGIFLVASQTDICTVTTAGEYAIWDYPALWRQELIEIIETSIPADASGFAKALLLGDRTGMDYETETALKVSGISHVIAVSGIHVSILFGLIYLVTGRRRGLTAIVGIPAVILFAAIAGFSPSIVRAGIMQCLVMLAMLLDKEYDPATALSFAALFMMVFNPLVITSVSFQLSVGCMAGIFLFAEPIRGWIMDEKRFGRWNGRVTRAFSSSVSITLSAMTFTTPLVAVYFGTVSLVGVVTNFLTLWVITFVFYGIILVCLAGCIFSSAAGVIGWIVAWPIRFVLMIAKGMADIPMAAVYTKSIYIVVWLVFCYGLLAVYLCIRKKRPISFAVAGVIGLCLSMALSWADPLMDKCRVTALDVGQGQCILLQSDGSTYIVDCGGSYSEEAADIAAETLLSQGVGCVDGVILTHYDGDHAGGLEYLLTRIDTQVLYLPFAQDTDGIGQRLKEQSDGQVLYIRDDMKVSYANTDLTIFAPVSYKFGNESSMCVLFQTENCDILITGDRDIRTEQILIERNAIPKLDLLIAGHHGSKHSTGDELLKLTQPEYVFISVGEDNPYNHPAQEVLARLKEYGCKVLRTDLYGTIVFRR